MKRIENLVKNKIMNRANVGVLVDAHYISKYKQWLITCGTHKQTAELEY